MPVLLILLTLTYCYHMPTGSTEPEIYQSSSSDFSHSEHPILVASKKFHIDTSTSNSKHILPLKSKSKRSRNRHNRNSRHKAYLTNHRSSSDINTRRYW
mmetsp:Transcript_55760/g.63085  ORF Transcript_55760/g.63085 Transcript_55760/m.63085 type:complete len:99 (+) Transcript_55760:175-471(+)